MMTMMMMLNDHGQNDDEDDHNKDDDESENVAIFLLNRAPKTLETLQVVPIYKGRHDHHCLIIIIM